MAKHYTKVPTVFQMEARECGAASLSMVLAYYGLYVPLEQVRVEAGVSRDGSNAGNLLRAAHSLGLEAKGYRMDLKGLLNTQPPCVIHWNFNHFVVYEGRKGKWCYINDPAAGRRRLSQAELDEAFTGIALSFRRKEGVPRQKNTRTIAHFLRERLRGQYQELAALAALGLLLVVPGVLVPLFSQLFIDQILLEGNRGWLAGFCALLGGVAVFQGVLTAYRGWMLDRLQNKLSLLSCHALLGHLFRLPIQFFDQRYAGDLAERVGHNDRVGEFLAGDLAETAFHLFSALFYLILLLLYSPLLTLIGAAAVAIDLLAVRCSASAVANSAIRMQQDEGKMIGVIYAGLGISSTLKASGVESEYINRVEGHYAKTIRMEQRLGQLQGVLGAVSPVTSQLASVLVLLFGCVEILRGQMTVGMLVAFTGLLGGFTSPVEQLAGFTRRIQEMKSSMGQVQDIMEYGQDEVYEEGEQRAMTEKLSGQVELRGVAFGYSRLAPPLIQDFSFMLPCGSSIALVGASGCGKSTVSKLISGLYLPWQGQVLFDGVPSQEIPRDVKFASIATVSQDIRLFSGTIRDNLTLWKQSVLEEDIIRAAKDACVHDIITKKPGAYEYLLSEGGKNLSGGQRQRLEIARALASNPTILVLDEATSALDPETEKEILDNIKRRGCTCVMVAHRLSAIRDCDEILVMEEGKIVQRGNHQSLMAQEGHYQRLVRSSGDS